MKIKLLSSGVNTSAIHWALQEHPELWNRHTARTESPASPHHGIDDIWVRFGTPEDAKTGEPHKAYWYEDAELIGDAIPMIEALCQQLGAKELGGVLITRIPPGKEVKPHTDPGWHARYYEKFAIQITSAPGQKFCFEGEELETRPGDLYWFDNQHLHWVVNPTPYERITMIVCARLED